MSWGHDAIFGTASPRYVYVAIGESSVRVDLIESYVVSDGLVRVRTVSGSDYEASWDPSLPDFVAVLSAALDPRGAAGERSDRPRPAPSP